MHKRDLKLILLLPALAAAASGAQAASVAEQTLLDSARQWQAEGREDRALVALQKLALVYPDDPGLQLRLGVLELRTNRIADAADRLATMQKKYPQDAATQELANEYRVATRDRLRMASVRRLVQVGEYGKALAAFNELFPEKPPGGALGEEYARILQRSGGQRSTAASRQQSAAAQHSQASQSATHHRAAPRRRSEPAAADIALGIRLRLLEALPAPGAEQTERQGDAPAALAMLPIPLRVADALDLAPLSAPLDAQQLQGLAATRAAILRSEGDAEAQAGQLDAARSDLQDALAITPDDPWLRLDLARLYACDGMAERGLALMSEGEALAPNDWDTRYAHALFLSSIDDRSGALALLSTIPPPQRSAGMQRLEQRLQLEQTVARADALAKAGHSAEAGDEYTRLLRENPDDLDLRLAYARLLAQSGARDAAIAMFKGINHDAAPDDAERRLSATRQLLDLGDAQDAALGIAALPAAAMDHDALLLAGRIAAKAGHRKDAFDDFEQAGAKAQQQTQRAAAEDAAADLERARPAYATGAVDFQSKPGDPGISRFIDIETPLELRMPGPASGTWMAQIDPVHVSAGRLPADFAAASPFGKVLAFGPAALAAFPGGAEQTQNGVALALGYSTARYRVDLGSTPIGFAVQNIAAGGEVSFGLGPLDAALGFARRPVNSTLLSYAGARDPVTGEIWGGVMKSGINAGLGHYESKWGSNVSAGYYRLDGRKVPANTELAARAYGYRLLYDARDMDLSLGLSATYWSYAKNLRYYSFGQGGYYSPQSYLAFGLPLDWEGRTGRLAYELRAVISVSMSRESASAYYPTDPQLQQSAGNPYYSGGSGSGIGYDLRGNVEYQFDPHWFAGGRFEIDRSAFYSPDFLTLYLRYEFTPHWWPIRYPPRAPLPYTQY